VKFPGSKLLHHWDLPAPNLSLDDLFRSCQQAGLTGFAELKTPRAVAMIFYYLGGEVNALYREGPVAYNGLTALERMRAQPLGDDGSISVFELPLDMAHLLRGITNRQKLRETLKSGKELGEFLSRMEKAEHTGTLEILTSTGSGMILLVRGRISNTYWESTGGLTFEKGEARQHVDQALDREEAMLFLSDFSRDIWKSRHEVQTSVRSRLERKDGDGAEQVASEETTLRQQVLDELMTQLPAVIQAFIFDLLTGVVLARKGKGATNLKVSMLAEKVPGMALYARDAVAQEEYDQVEMLEISTERVAVLVAVVPEAQEAIAVLAEKAQPTALLGAALLRMVRSYAARLHPARGMVSAQP
jgi:hypothetical protein